MSVRFMSILKERKAEERYHSHCFILDDTTISFDKCFETYQMRWNTLYSDSLLDLDSLTINNQFDMERYKQLMIQMLEVSKAFSVILNQESRFTFEKREKNGHIEYDININ